MVTETIVKTFLFHSVERYYEWRGAYGKNGCDDFFKSSLSCRHYIALIAIFLLFSTVREMDLEFMQRGSSVCEIGIGNSQFVLLAELRNIPIN